jgi:hypothetical protein
VNDTSATGGDVTIEIDLGQIQVLDWVGVHLLDQNAPSIFFPTAMALDSRNDPASAWSPLGSWPVPVSRFDSEYVMSNDVPLGASLRYLRVRLTNPNAWTFISEIELVAR